MECSRVLQSLNWELLEHLALTEAPESALNDHSYRIYTALGLNHGNFNAFLKHGDCSKVSLATVRRAAAFLEAQQ